MQYRAFISYSHAADGRFAPALQSALHRFARPWYRLRALRVFRDETNLSVSPALWSSIEAALADSEYFILLASPLSASSKWVRREVDYWLTHKPCTNLLIALTDGEIIWDEASGDFDWRRTDALPANLARVFSEEPHHGDFRWARTAADLSFNNPVFRERVAHLASTLHNRPKDQLIGEDVRQHRNLRRVAWAAVSVLALLAGYAEMQRRESARQADIAVQRQREAEAARDRADRAAAAEKIAREREAAQRERAENAQKEAERQRDFAREQQRIAEDRRRLAESRQLAASAMARLPADPELSTLFALEAVKVSPTVEAVDSLRQALPELYLERTLRAHEHVVVTAKFTPDGEYLVTGDGYGVVGLWDAKAGRLLASARAHERPALKAAVSADSAWAATASTDGSAQVWDLRNAKALGAPVRHKGVVTDVAFSPDGAVLATASQDGSVRLWRFLPELKLVQELQHGVAVENIQFSQDGKWLATSAGNSVRVWDVSMGKSVTWLKMADHPIGPAFTRDGRYVIQPMPGRPAQIWEVGNTQSGWSEIKQTIPTVHPQMSPDGTLFVTFSGSMIRVWRVGSGAPYYELRGHADTIRSAVFSADGRWLLTSSNDRTARLWSTLHWGTAAVLRGHSNAVYDAQFSPNNRRIVTAGDDSARIWQVDGSRAVVPLSGHGAAIRQVAFHSTGQFVFTASVDNLVRSWWVPSGSAESTECRHPRSVMTVQPSADGRYLLSASVDGVVRVWRWTPFSCELHTELTGHGGGLTGAAFSPDQKQVAAASGERTVKIWDWAARKVVRELRGHTSMVNSLAFSPDGSRIVTASADGSARVWLAPAGVEAVYLRGHGAAIVKATFDAAGGRVATASTDKTARVWDARTGRVIFRFDAHRASVTDATFSKNGKFLITTSEDGVVRLWDLMNGTVVGSLLPRSAPASAVALSPDGRYLLLAEKDSRARIYPWEMIAPLGELQSLAQSRLKRRLTAAERLQYLSVGIR